MAVGSGTGTSGGTKVVYVDTRVPTSGPSHTVINRRDKRGSTIYVYRTVYYHVAPTPQQEHVSQVKHSGGTGGTGGSGFSASNNDWVRRRQRFLRAAGYNIAVDGIWGSASQAAWNRYIGNINNAATAGTTSAITAAEKRIMDFKERKREAEARAKQALAAAQRRMEMSRNRLAAIERSRPTPSYDDVEDLRIRRANDESRRIEQVFTRRKAETVAGYEALRAARLRDILRNDPKHTKNFSIREIRLILTNPSTGWDPTNPRDVIGVQEWLKAHGHPNMEVDGVWGTQTNQALMDDLRKYERKERKEAIHEIVGQFYDTGILQAGENAPWWYSLGGKTPKPGELLRLLDRGGFTAAIILRELYRQMKTPTFQFAQWRTEQIDRMHASMNASDFSYNFMEKLLPTPEWKKVADILLYPGFTTQQRSQLSAQLGFLQSSTTIDQFTNRMRAYTATEEAIMRMAAQQDSEKGWFGTALDGFIRFGDEFQRVVVGGGQEFWEMLQDPLDYDWQAGPRSEEEQEQIKRRAEAWIQGLPTWQRLIFELTVDPVNFVPFGKAFSVTARGIAKAGEAATLAGYFVRAGDTTVERVIGNAIVDTGRALEATPELRQILRNYRISAVNRLAVPGEMAGVGEHLIASVIKNARIATTLKTSALRTAQDGVSLVARHAFRPVEGLGIKVFKPSNATMRLVEQSTERAILDLNGPMKETLEQMREMSGSFYAKEDRDIQSALGRMFSARGNEEMRIQELQSLALREAHRAVQALEDQGVKLTKSAKEAAMLNEYIRVRSMFGSYLRGSSLPEIANAEGELVMILQSFERRTLKLQEQWNEVLMPRMQDWMERQMDAAGVSLWDKEGAWAFANGDAAVADLRRTLDGLTPTPEDHDALVALVKQLGEVDTAAAALAKEGAKSMPAKELYKFADDTISGLETRVNKIRAMREEARKTFSEDELVPTLNPVHGVRMTPDMADEFIESEYRRRTSRVIAYYESEKAAGSDRGLAWLEAEKDAIRQDIESHWQRDMGRMFDDRETVMESKLYSRHIQMSKDELTREFTDLQRVGHFPKGPDQEIKRLAFHMRGGFTHPADVKMDDALRYFDRRVDKAEDPIVEQTARLADSLKLNALALKKASDEALPSFLRGQFALMTAMQQTQTKPYRMIERGVTGALSAWIFLTLPMRPGWIARNVVDNATKTLLNGAIDPRMYWPEGFASLGKGVKSVFDLGLREMRYMTEFLDDLMGTDAGKYFSEAMETFWHHNEDVLRRFFEKYLIPVPDVVLKGTIDMPYKRVKPMDQYGKYGKELFEQGDGEILYQADPELYKRLADEKGKLFDSNGVPIDPADIDQHFWERVKFFKRDWWWEVTAQRPEAFFKAGLYRKEYYKQIKLGKNEVQAFKIAGKKVEDTLFDYSKITVAEDNFRIFFPFIQFWRKNTSFWIKTMVKNPWIPYEIYKFDELRMELHDDLPTWMRRYFKVELPFADMLSVIPGMDWLADWVGNQDVYVDPLNYFSFAPMYRSFKQDNPLLPADKAGWKFIAPFADAIQQWGLGFSPFFSRPMQDMGIFNYRAWQTVFPQTSPLAAFTRAFISERGANFLLDLDASLADPLLSGIMRDFGTGASEAVARSMNQYVQQEMANQALRGETVSRERATEKLQNFFLAQTMVGYFTGLYVRRMTPEDIWLAQFSEQAWLSKMNGGRPVDYDNLTEDQQAALNLYHKRKWSPLAFDNYVEQIPVMQGYFRQATYEAGQRYLQEHPEIIPMVEPLYKGKPFSTDSLRNVQLVMDTEAAMNLFELIDKAQLSPETTGLANDMLVTPALKRFWASNDTPQEIRQRQIQGEYFRFMHQTEQAYFSIPDNDFEAKDGFLAEHPWLQAWWAKNDQDSDEYKAIMNAANADLREAYFDLLGDGPDPDWDAATAFLKQHPFMFEFTSAAHKVDPATGEWLGSGFSRSQHAADYARAKSFLQYYFRLAPAARESWLNGGSEGAAIVRAYFAKYSSGGSRGGMTQHAKDYLAAKPYLDQYFALPQNKRDEWLHSGSPAAEVVLNYFKRYGKTHQATRSFNSIPGLTVRNAELRQRLEFWRKYFNLTPDKRPAFIMNHAEDAGIFVFGIFGEQQRYNKMMEYMRNAIAGGATPRAAAYMWVKPLLDMFFKLKKSERGLFMKANPELEWYFDNYARQDSPTGDPKLDKLLDRYFNLPAGSDERTMMLEKHPEIQDYFDEKASPKERALRNLLEVYFSIPQRERKEFLMKHPEIQEYFDQRAAARDEEKFQLLPFELADPRMQKYYKDTYFIGEAGEDERNKLLAQKAANLAGDDLTVRRKREPAES